MIKSLPLNQERFGPLKAKRRVHFADIPSGVSKETVLQHSYWANIAKYVTARDHIEADWEDGSRLVILRVISATSNSLNVIELKEYEFMGEKAAKPADDKDDLIVKFMGQKKWSVIRKSNPKDPYVKSGMDSEEAAQEWLAKYLSGEAKAA